MSNQPEQPQYVQVPTDQQQQQQQVANALASVSNPAVSASNSNYPAFDLGKFWSEQMQLADTFESDFKNHPLPLARIKKVMKTDQEVKMISAEAPVLFAKGCEIFITELTKRAWVHAEENKRRTLQRSDIATAISKTDMCDFLIDIVPREEAVKSQNTGFEQQQQQAAAVSQQATAAAEYGAYYPTQYATANPQDNTAYAYHQLTPEQMQQYHLQIQQFQQQQQYAAAAAVSSATTAATATEAAAVTKQEQ